MPRIPPPGIQGPGGTPDGGQPWGQRGHPPSDRSGRAGGRKPLTGKTYRREFRMEPEKSRDLAEAKMFTGVGAPEKWQNKSMIVKKHKDDYTNPPQPQEVTYLFS